MDSLQIFSHLSFLLYVYFPLFLSRIYCFQSAQEVLEHPVLFASNDSLNTYVAPWETLPSTPELPGPKTFEGLAAINGIDLWYSLYGSFDDLSTTVPIVFLHGGFASSEYWGDQVKYLLDLNISNPIITVDSRAQGRSSDDLTKPLSYDALTDDVLALMDFLSVEKFSIVGWSDGGSIGLSLCANHSDRIDRFFSFSGLYHTKNNNETLADSPVTQAYLQRAKEEYKKLSQTPDSWDLFYRRMMDMWDSGPTWNAESFQSIPNIYDHAQAPLIWIVSGDSEEVVTRNTPSDLFSWVRFDQNLLERRDVLLTTLTDMGLLVGATARSEPFCVRFEPLKPQD